MLNKSKVQEEFHNYGIQISRSTVRSINDFIYKLVRFTIKNAVDNKVNDADSQTVSSSTTISKESVAEL